MRYKVFHIEISVKRALLRRMYQRRGRSLMLVKVRKDML